MPRPAQLNKTPPAPLLTYGCPIGGKSQLFYDMWAFTWKIPIDNGAPPRTDLFWRVIERINSTFLERHPWTNRMIEGLCHNRWLGLSGCASSAKTRNVVGYACTWWLTNPGESSVIFCSTTAKALRKRGWAEVQKYHSSVPGPRIGNFVDSRMLWQAEKGDDRHSISGIAVEEGDTNKVADNIKGVHTKRQLVIIDEATAVPPAIFEACTNLYRSPREFVLVMVANPRSRLDQFGKFIEPDKGWESVTVEDEEWETTPKIDGTKGICLRFDIEKSPNLDHPEDKPISRYIPSRAHVERVRSNVSYHNSPSYWSNERGFPPPDGLARTIFSETSISTFDGRGRHRFTGDNFKIIGAFDHARDGGDRPTLRFAAMGEVESGKVGIELLPPIIIPVNAAASNPIDFQIVEQLKRECENVDYRGQKLACDPGNFGIDATGGGADLTDIAQRVWSPHVTRIGFSEAASTDACSLEDVRPANEVYRNLRAEMYHRARIALESSQLKGIDRESEKELCSIEFLEKFPIQLMSKKDYRKKFTKSCDLADTVVMCVEMAKRRGFKLSALGHTVKKYQEFTDTVRQSQDVFLSVSYEEDYDTEAYSLQ